MDSKTQIVANNFWLLIENPYHVFESESWVFFAGYLFGGAVLMSWLETDNDQLMRESARQKKLDFIRQYPEIKGEIIF